MRIASRKGSPCRVAALRTLYPRATWGRPRLPPNAGFACIDARDAPGTGMAQIKQRFLKQRFALALLLASLASASFAQFGGGMGGGGGRHGRNPDATNTPAAEPSNPLTRAARLRDALYDLRLRLTLTPEQGPLYDAFYNAVWDMATQGAMTPVADPDMTAIQVVQQRSEAAGLRATQLKAVADAVGKLYDGMTPDQRRIADRDLPGVIP
jgi:hypothetical protein